MKKGVHVVGTRENFKAGVGMIDPSSKGLRCRAAQDIFSYEGTIQCCAEGTIVYELVGCNGHLVNVYWDLGVNSLVSPGEILVTDPEVMWH